VTSGFHNQQFIVWGGTAKQGKSFMLMKSAIAAQEQQKKVLFLSFEMSAYEQLCRYDAICCGINSMKLLYGELSDEEMKKLVYGMKARRHYAPFIISSDISASTTVSGLAGKIEQHQPDIVFVDGVYLMEPEGGEPPGSPQAYTSISRGLKRLAQRINKPLVVTTQALEGKLGKSKAITLHSLGWTSAWSQDADLVLGVERDPEQPLLCLRVVAGRNVSPRAIGVAINWEESILVETEIPESEYEGDNG
jgi:replicative DNA helicase